MDLIKNFNILIKINLFQEKLYMNITNSIYYWLLKTNIEFKQIKIKRFIVECVRYLDLADWS